MIKFMVGVMCFFMACFGIIIFLCACILGLCTLDYILDSDIKGYLVKELGPRNLLKKIRSKTKKIMDKFNNDKTDDRWNLIANDRTISSRVIMDIKDYIKDNPEKGELCLAGFAEEKAKRILQLFDNNKHYEAQLKYDEKNSFYIISYQLVK